MEETYEEFQVRFWATLEFIWLMHTAILFFIFAGLILIGPLHDPVGFWVCVFAQVVLIVLDRMLLTRLTKEWEQWKRVLGYD